MAAPDFTDEGFGCSVTFGTSGHVFRIDSVSMDGIERAVIETDHMLTTEGWITKQPSDRKNPGRITLNVHHDPSLNWVTLLAAAVETITFIGPVPAGLSNGATIAATGFAISYTPNIAKDAKMTATLVLELSGKPTITAAS